MAPQQLLAEIELVGEFSVSTLLFQAGIVLAVVAALVVIFILFKRRGS